MKKYLINFLIYWAVIIFVVITGACLLYFVELMGGIIYLFPLMFFSLFILKEIKDYREASRKRDL